MIIPKIPHRYRILIILCSLTTLTYLDRICISILGVRIKTEFGLSNEQFGWVLAAFALAYAIFEIPAGVLGDRIGSKAIFIRIVLAWSLFTALTGLATGLVSLIIIRFLFGIGESGTYPNCMITMSRWFPVKEMGRALTWIGIGSQIGSAIAPLIIIPLAISFGWRIPFYVLAVVGIIWVLICYYWFKNLPEEVKNISPKEKTLIENNRRYNTAQHSISWKIILRNKNLRALMLMYFCCQWANYFFIAWMPIYLQEGRMFSEKETKPIIFILFIIGIAGFLLGGFIGDLLVQKKGLLFGRRFVGMLGLGLCGLLIFFAAIIPNNTIAAYCLVGANGCFSFGVMVSYAVCTDIGKNNAGTVTGAMNFFGQMGAFFLAMIFGKVLDLTNNYSYPVFLVSAVMITGCLLWLKIDPTKQVSMKGEVVV
ncbi:MAG: MFS transporter [Ferruginibacter sp.]